MRVTPQSEMLTVEEAMKRFTHGEKPARFARKHHFDKIKSPAKKDKFNADRNAGNQGA